MAKLLHFKSGSILSFSLTLIASFLLVTTSWGQETTTTTSPNLQAYAEKGLPNPTVASDKDDYAPGEIAIITGTGWTLDSAVDIHLEEDPYHAHHHGYHGTPVDSLGNWKIEYPIEERHLGVKFTVIVDGVQSKYQGRAYFTDGNLSFVVTGLPSGSVTVSHQYSGAGSGSPGPSTTFLANGQPQTGVAFSNNTNVYFKFPTSVSILGIEYVLNNVKALGATGNNTPVEFALSNSDLVGYEYLFKNNLNVILAADYKVAIKSTSLYAAPATGTYAGTTNLSATLTSNSAGVSGKTISFSLNGNPVGTAFTDASGLATLESASLAGVNANTYPSGIAAAFAGDATHSSSNGSAALTVNKAESTIVVTGTTTFTYSGSAQGPDAVTKNGSTGLVTFSYEGISGTTYPASATKPTNAGSYQVIATLTGDANFNGKSSEALGFTIDKASLTVVNTSREKVYGNVLTASDFAGSISGLQVIDNITVTRGSAGSVANAAVNNYAIIGTLVDPDNRLGNYEVSNPEGNLKVTKAALTVITDDKNKTYGEIFSAFTGDVTGEVAGDAFSIASYASNGAAANATVAGGPYEISATLTASDRLANYTVTNDFGELTIGKAALTVITDDKNKTYGEIFSAFTGDVTGEVAGDVFLIASYASNGAAANATVAGGPYEISATLTASDRLANYTVTNDFGELTVGKAALTVITDDKNKTYGEIFSAFTGDVTGEVAGDAFSIASYASNGAAANATVAGGPYEISATLTASDRLANYTVTNDFGELTVGKAALTVITDDKNKTYGEIFSAFTGDVTGEVAGDVFSIASYASNGAAANATVAGGPYEISATLTASDRLANYTVTNDFGELTVGKAALTVITDDKNKTYGDVFSAFTGDVTGEVAGDAFSIASYASNGAAANATVAGGPYEISATLTASDRLANYTVTNDFGELTVGKAALTVITDDKNKTYGEIFSAFTGDVTGEVAGDVFSIASYASNGAAANATVAGGPYEISATLTASDRLANYTVTNDFGELTVGKAALTVITDDKNKTYGEIFSAFTGDVTGEVAGDAFSIASYASNGAAANATVAGGPYEISATLTASDRLANYTVTNDFGELTVDTKTLIVTADNQEKFCGQTVTFTGTEYTQAGLVNEDAITSVTLTSDGAAASVNIKDLGYVINIKDAIGTGLGNYTIKYISGLLAVKPVTIDITSAQNPRSINEDVLIKIPVKDGVTALPGVDIKLTVGGKTYFATTALINSPDKEMGTAYFNLGKLTSGLYSVTAQAGGCSETETVFLPIYDPNGGFVTGGGWIESPVGAYKLNTAAEGRANFGFNAKYKTGRNNTTEVDGHTNFQFKAGDLHFSSSVHHAMSLVVSGAKATYTGEGTINGTGSYEFRLIAVDGNLVSSTETDKFRIKIWTKGSPSSVIYDNELINYSESADPTTKIAGGSIVIHKPKGNTKTAETSEKTSTTTIAVAEEPLTIDILESLAVAPNPVKTDAKVRFSLLENANVTVRLFDFNGREIYNLYSGSANAKQVYEVGFQRNNLMSGIYIVRLTTDRGNSYTKQVIVE